MSVWMVRASVALALATRTGRVVPRAKMPVYPAMAITGITHRAILNELYLRKFWWAGGWRSLSFGIVCIV
jgi:hypothetical protein